MNDVINVYCDESCHLEHDGHPYMVLGALWCPLGKTREISQRIREIKVQHNLPPDFEIKWTKISPAKQQFYEAIVDYFFDNQDLHFRGLIAKKTGLRHEDFGQDHDTWYYKMYYTLLGWLFSPECRYRIYLDVKDTCGESKRRMLHEVLCNKRLDFRHEIIERLQTISSKQVEQAQICDLLTGALSHINRGLTSSAAKTAIIERIRKRSDLQLTKTTLMKARKVNLFFWDGS